MENRGKNVLIVGALGLSTVAIIAALTKKVKAAPEDKTISEALMAILALTEDTQIKSNAIIQALEALDIEVPMEKTIEQIPFARNLPIAGAVGSGVVLTEIAPFDGYIKEITIHWPEGSDALVDIRVGRGVEQFCPREGFLALNDTTPSYLFNVPVKQNDEIWVEMMNTDGVNTHAITVTVHLESN